MGGLLAKIVVGLLAILVGLVLLDPRWAVVAKGLLVWTGLPFQIDLNFKHVDFTDAALVAKLKQNIRQIKVLENIEDIALDWDAPAIIRNAAPNCVEELLSYPNDADVTVYDMLVKDHGTTMRSGCEYSGKSTVHPVQKMISQKVDFTDQFGAFATFLTDEQTKEVAPDFIMSHGGSMARDTNFISNFSQPVISTAIHAAALVRSWSLQCAGEKRWLLFPPEANDLSIALASPAVLPTQWDEEAIFSSSDFNVLSGRVLKGDLLYFPPNWMHLVESRPGVNVMLNFREIALPQAFRLNPYLSAMTLMIRGLDNIFNNEQRSQQFRPLNFRNPLDMYMSDTFNFKGKEAEGVQNSFLLSLFDEASL